MTSGVTNPNSSDLKTELRNSQEENEASTMNGWRNRSLKQVLFLPQIAPQLGVCFTVVRVLFYGRSTIA